MSDEPYDRSYFPALPREVRDDIALLDRILGALGYQDTTDDPVEEILRLKSLEHAPKRVSNTHNMTCHPTDPHCLWPECNCAPPPPPTQGEVEA
jgi:hypothetical protein